MNVSDCMSRNVRLCSPNDSLRDAARAMKEADAGFLPVGENDRLVGMITDRDIVVRAVAAGKEPDECRIRDIMSPAVKYVFEDETTDDLAQQLAELQIKRMPVVDRNKRLVGIVSLGDIAVVRDSTHEAAAALSGISRPSTGAATHAHI